MYIYCGVKGEGGLMNGTIIQGFLSNTRVRKVFRGRAHLHQVKA